MFGGGAVQFGAITANLSIIVVILLRNRHHLQRYAGQSAGFYIDRRPRLFYYFLKTGGAVSLPDIIQRILALFKKKQQLTREDLQLLRSLDEPKEINPALAYALVLMQAARADNVVEPVERASVTSILTKKLGVPPRDVDALLDQADAMLRSGAGLDALAGHLRDSLSLDDKKMLLARVKGIVSSDGFISPIEDQIVLRVAQLLNIDPEP